MYREDFNAPSSHSCIRPAANAALRTPPLLPSATLASDNHPPPLYCPSLPTYHRKGISTRPNLDAARAAAGLAIEDGEVLQQLALLPHPVQHPAPHNAGHPPCAGKVMSGTRAPANRPAKKRHGTSNRRQGDVGKARANGPVRDKLVAVGAALNTLPGPSRPRATQTPTPETPPSPAAADQLGGRRRGADIWRASVHFERGLHKRSAGYAICASTPALHSISCPQPVDSRASAGPLAASSPVGARQHTAPRLAHSSLPRHRAACAPSQP